VCERLNFDHNGKGYLGNATAANRTREIRPSGMRGGLAETRIRRILNGHVKRKRRNSQVFSYVAVRRISWSSRQGCNLAGESPAMTIVRVQSYSDATAQGR